MRGPLSQAIVSQTEWAFAADEWARWTAAHPDYSPEELQTLQQMIMEMVIMFRLTPLVFGRHRPQFDRVYHASFHRMMRCRRQLEASVRQRQLPFDLASLAAEFAREEHPDSWLRLRGAVA